MPPLGKTIYVIILDKSSLTIGNLCLADPLNTATQYKFLAPSASTS